MPKSRGGPERAAHATALDDELIALLRLRALPGIGDLRGRELIDLFGSASAALHAPAKMLGAAAAAARDSTRVQGWIETALRTIDELNVHVIPQGDVRYPARFARLPDPPLVVFARGSLELLDVTACGVVGTRRATEYGCDAARLLAGAVARDGVVIVSGMARGIDGAAHVAALECGGGTIAVLGAGPDVVYPREHAALHEQIAREGLLLSEFLPGTPVNAGHFVRRNRLIAALSHVLIVVEAPMKSGALTTVRHALELGVDVLAVPGPIGRPSFVGSNELIRDGAAVALEGRDVLDALRLREAADGVTETGTVNGPGTEFSEAEAEGGSVSGTGSGAEAGSGSGAEAGSGSGAEAESGSGAEAESGSDGYDADAAEGERIDQEFHAARLTKLRWSIEHKPKGQNGRRLHITPLDPPPRDPQLATVWRALEPDSQHVDVITERAALPAPAVVASLLQLELDGRAQRAAGMLYRRVR